MQLNLANGSLSASFHLFFWCIFLEQNNTQAFGDSSSSYSLTIPLLHLYKFKNLLDPRYCPPMPKMQVQTHFHIIWYLIHPIHDLPLENKFEEMVFARHGVHNLIQKCWCENYISCIVMCTNELLRYKQFWFIDVNLWP